MRIITRDEWDAAPTDPARPRRRDPMPWEALWLHHTAGRRGGVGQVREIQRQHQARGWRDGAYNLAVADDAVYELMGIGYRHLNSDAGRSGTIVLVGNFDTQPVPEAMVDRAAETVCHLFLIGVAVDRIHDDEPHLTGGHSDLAATACPGRYGRAVIPEINRRAKAMFCALTNLPAPEEPTVIRAGSSGEHVEDLQGVLTFWGFYTGRIDGVHGPASQAAAKAMKTEMRKTSRTPSALGDTVLWGWTTQREYGAWLERILGA